MVINCSLRFMLHVSTRPSDELMLPNRSLDSLLVIVVVFPTTMPYKYVSVFECH